MYNYDTEGINMAEQRNKHIHTALLCAIYIAILTCLIFISINIFKQRQILQETATVTEKYLAVDNFIKQQEEATKTKLQNMNSKFKYADWLLETVNSDFTKYQTRKILYKLQDKNKEIEERTTKSKLFSQLMYSDDPIQNDEEIYIPSCGLTVPIKKPVHVYPGDWQKIIDEEDQGLHYIHQNVNMLCDHAGQGFDLMKQAKVGTMAYIKSKHGIEFYRCIGIESGKNVKYALLNADGGYISNKNQGDLLMYTCNDETGVSITISYWERVKGFTDDLRFV